MECYNKLQCMKTVREEKKKLQHDQKWMTVIHTSKTKKKKEQ